MTSLIQETKAALRELGISPRKKMGQNFMIHEESLQAIANALALKEGESVVEIGAGLGFLTRVLLQEKAQVVAIEKDAVLAGRLKNAFKGRPLEIVESDILKLNLKKDLGLDGPIKLAGNIPYHITSPLLEWLVDQRRVIQEAVLTVQWEVALRLTASPNTKAWGALSIFVQVYSQTALVQKIDKSHFYPVPKVDSAIVRLKFSDKPLYPIGSEEKFFALVRRAFQKRRKTLLNSLRADDEMGLSKQVLLDAFEKAHLDPRRRPETLSIPEWAALSDILS